MNIILTVQTTHSWKTAQSPHFDQDHTFALIKRKTASRCKKNNLQNATVSRNKKKTPFKNEDNSIDFEMYCLCES